MVQTSKDGLDITRIKEPTKQDYQRLEKYKKAILYLATH